MMLLVAILCMVASFTFLFFPSSELVSEIGEIQKVENSTSDKSGLFDTNNEFLGKIAIIIFTVLGTICFLILQILWFKKFFQKLARVNREIKIDIEDKGAPLLRNFNIDLSLSTIRKFFL